MSKQWLILMVTLMLLLTTMPLLAACDDDDEEITRVTTTQVTTTTETTRAIATEATTTPQTTTTTAPAGSLTIDSSIGEILDDPGGEVLLRKCLGDEIVDNPQMSMAFGMNLPTIAPMSGGVITDEMLACVNEGLGGTPMATAQPTKTPGPTKTISACPREEEFVLGSIATVMGMTAEARDYSPDTAMREINEAGGVRIGDTCIKFKFHQIDDKGTSVGALSAIQKLLYEVEADAIWSPGSNPVQSTVWRPYTEKEEIIAFANYLSEEWIGQDYPYAFRFWQDTLPAPLYLLDWVSKNRPDIKTVHVLRAQIEEMERQSAVLKKAALPEFGIEYTGTDWHETQTRDFYPMLTSALKGDPDALMIDFYSAQLVTKQARELGFEGTFIVVGAIPDFALKAMTPEEKEGIISLSPSLESPLVPQHYKDYREHYYELGRGYPYSIITWGGYLVVYYLAAAIEAAGSTDSDKLKEVMETQTLTLEFPSGETLDVKLSGAKHFGVNHAWQPPEYISVVQNGQPVVMEEITAEKFDHYMDMYMKYR